MQKWIKILCVAVLSVTVGYGVGTYSNNVRRAPVIESVETPSVWQLERKGFIRTADEVVQPIGEKQSVVRYIWTNVLDVGVPIVATGLTALVFGILGAVLKKFNIQISQETHKHLEDVAETAVHRVEAWAKNQASTPSTNDKLNFGVQTLHSLLDNPIAKQYTQEELAHYIEEAVKKHFPKVVGDK